MSKKTRLLLRTCGAVLQKILFFFEMKHAKIVHFVSREREEQIWPEVNAIIRRKNWKTFSEVNFAYCFMAYILSFSSIHSIFCSIDSVPEVYYAHQFSHRNLINWSNQKLNKKILAKFSVLQNFFFFRNVLFSKYLGPEWSDCNTENCTRNPERFPTHLKKFV